MPIVYNIENVTKELNMDIYTFVMVAMRATHLLKDHAGRTYTPCEAKIVTEELIEVTCVDGTKLLHEFSGNAVEAITLFYTYWYDFDVATGEIYPR